MPFIVYDENQFADVPQSLAELTNQQIQDIVDIYVSQGNALTIRKLKGFPRNVCREAYAKLEALRVEMEQIILADNTISAADCLAALTVFNSVPAIQEYCANQIVQNGCSEGTWLDFRQAVIDYFATP